MRRAAQMIIQAGMKQIGLPEPHRFIRAPYFRARFVWSRLLNWKRVKDSGKLIGFSKK